MKCQDVQQALDAQLVGTLGRADAEALDAHLATCPECQAMVADARRLQAELRLIGVEGPSPRVWERVSARLEADPEFERAAAAAVEAAPRSLPHRLALGGAGRHAPGGHRRFAAGAAPLADDRHRRRLPAVATAPADAGSDAIVSSIESELDLAAKHYENAIAGLERVASESDSPIDPAVMATVKENLEIIDQAIDDSRQALRTDPQSQLAQESLFDAFRRKVALLQDTISLMNEMRKGNPARATAIASGLNKG